MAVRRRTGRKRGRPYNPNAKRHQTTRAGRRGDVDLGTARLRLKKLRATGRTDVEMTPAGILFGRELIDRYQYDSLAFVTMLLRRVARSMGRQFTVDALWRGLLAAGSPPSSFVPSIIGDSNARLTLARICRRMNGCRVLVIELAEERSIPPMVVRAVEHRLTPLDLVELEELRKCLDDIRAPGWWADEASDPPSVAAPARCERLRPWPKPRA
jgi:hypothetical protein